MSVFWNIVVLILLVNVALILFAALTAASDDDDWRQRIMDNESITSVEIPVFEEVEVHTNCTVQVLRNTLTGKVSVGWWENGHEPPKFDGYLGRYEIE